MTLRFPPDPPGRHLARAVRKTLHISDNKLGFTQSGVFITDPFVSICGRFPADPIEDYGLTAEQVAQFEAKRGD